MGKTKEKKAKKLPEGWKSLKEIIPTIQKWFEREDKGFATCTLIRWSFLKDKHPDFYKLAKWAIENELLNDFPHSNKLDHQISRTDKFKELHRDLIQGIKI